MREITSTRFATVWQTCVSLGSMMPPGLARGHVKGHLLRRLKNVAFNCEEETREAVYETEVKALWKRSAKAVKSRWFR